MTPGGMVTAKARSHAMEFTGLKAIDDSRSIMLAPSLAIVLARSAEFTVPMSPMKA